MNKKQAEILSKLQEFGKQMLPVYMANVVAVDETALTAEIEVNGLSPLKCYLSGAEDSIKGFVTIPAVGSTIMAARVDEHGDIYVLLQATEVDKLHVNMHGFTFTIDNAGIKLGGDNSNLKQTLSDLIDAINQLTVTTPAGPSGMPINTASFKAIKEDLQNYLS
ncbi:MAG: hypothetical protein HC896_12865 [Bacteroidales bacterium]|nr:hypothetical protein [Bacteroidales bacterium]